MLIKVLPLVFLTLSWISTKKTRAFFLWGTVFDPGANSNCNEICIPTSTSAVLSAAPIRSGHSPGIRTVLDLLIQKTTEVSTAEVYPIVGVHK